MYFLLWYFHLPDPDLMSNLMKYFVYFNVPVSNMSSKRGRIKQSFLFGFEFNILISMQKEIDLSDLRDNATFDE